MFSRDLMAFLILEVEGWWRIKSHKVVELIKDDFVE